MGGITNATDAVEFFLAGASAVTVGMYNFVEPAAAVRVIEGLRDYLKRHRIPGVGQLVGALTTG
ncbi:hypothetical protein SY88_04760 [Clostridiales bacterium PH28_bin88]|nr:hypothetical protein SY88_04760 [Clostridiales bacterium PH28_bin88]